MWLPELVQLICVHSVLHRFAATHFNVCSQWRCLLKVNHRRPCSFYAVGTVGAAVGPHWMSCVRLWHSIARSAPTVMGRIEQCVFVARFFDLSLFAPALLEQQCVQSDCVFLHYIVFCGLQRCVHSDRGRLCISWSYGFNYGFNWFVCASGFGTRLFTQHIWQVCIVAGAGPIVFWSHSLAQSFSQSFRCLFNSFWHFWNNNVSEVIVFSCILLFFADCSGTSTVTWHRLRNLWIYGFEYRFVCVMDMRRAGFL